MEANKPLMRLNLGSHIAGTVGAVAPVLHQEPQATKRKRTLLRDHAPP